jgi:hypothetical protein
MSKTKEEALQVARDVLLSAGYTLCPGHEPYGVEFQIYSGHELIVFKRYPYDRLQIDMCKHCSCIYVTGNYESKQ